MLHLMDVLIVSLNVYWRDLNLTIVSIDLYILKNGKCLSFTVLDDSTPGPARLLNKSVNVVNHIKKNYANYNMYSICS